MSGCAVRAVANLGALGVLNLEGVQCRYDDPNPVLDRIAARWARKSSCPLMQELYSQPVQEDADPEAHPVSHQGAAAALPQ